MAASFVKPPGENVLDPVYLHGHVPRRQTRDFADGHRVHVFEIRDDDLAIERFELLDQPGQAVEIETPVRGGFVFGGKHVEIFQSHQIFEDAALAKDVRRGDMVGNAIDPGPQRTAGVELLKAAPQLKMNLLVQVTALFRVSLVSVRQLC